MTNLRNAAQGLAALQARQQQQHEQVPAGGGDSKPREAPVLIEGDTVEARAVFAAVEQCLFHRIRVKEFGEKFRNCSKMLICFYFLYPGALVWLRGLGLVMMLLLPSLNTYHTIGCVIRKDNTV